MLIDIRHGTTDVQSLPPHETVLDFPGLQNGFFVIVLADKTVSEPGNDSGRFYYKTVLYQYVEGLRPVDMHQANLASLLNGVTDVSTNICVVFINSNVAGNVATSLFDHFDLMLSDVYNFQNIGLIIQDHNNSIISRWEILPAGRRNEHEEVNGGDGE